MRTRSRNTMSQGTFTAIRQFYAASVYPPTGMRSVLPFEKTGTSTSNASEGRKSGIIEVILDEQPGFKSIGAVDHTKRVIGRFPIDDFAVYDGTTYASISGTSSIGHRMEGERRANQDPAGNCWNWARSERLSFDAETCSDASLGLASVINDDRLAWLIPRVMNRIENLHLANSSWEATEFPSLFKMFKRGQGLRSINSMLRDWVEGTSRSFKGDKFSRHFARTFRDGQLNWSFGLQPTISDFRAIVEELKNPKKVSKTFTLTERNYYNDKDSSYRFNLTHGPQTSNRELSKLKVWGVRGTYIRKPYASAFIEDLDNNVKRYIGHNPASIIWEAIPFSWAIDWFTSLDRVLDSFWLQNQSEYALSWWESTKIKAEHRMKYSVLESIRSPAPGGWSVPVLKKYTERGEIVDSYSHYNRIGRTSPNVLLSLRPRLGFKQAYLGALVASGFVKRGR